MPVAIAACVLAAIAWVYLLTGHGGYWRTDQRLPRPGREAAVPGGLRASPPEAPPGGCFAAGERQPLVGTPVTAVTDQQVHPGDRGEQAGGDGYGHRHSLAYERAKGRGAVWTEPGERAKGRGADWTEERGSEERATERRGKEAG